MIDLATLNQTNRLLFKVPLRPVQGDRFQPTGFPSLGAATYQTKEGPKLLVESAQSMANRLELTCWDGARNQPVAVLDGISHVTVNRRGAFLTDSMLEAHRLNSTYVLDSLDSGNRLLLAQLREDLGGLEEGPINRKKLAETLLKFDVGSLIHGVFLAKKELAGGRLRVARVLTAFIEASGVEVAPSGGVKNDHVHPGRVRNDPKNLIGNIPFSRDEFVADAINLFVNLDLAQIRGYGLEPKIQTLLILLALHRLRKLLDGDLRLRTACDLEVEGGEIVSRPVAFKLPPLAELETDVKKAIDDCKSLMKHFEVTYERRFEEMNESDDTTTDEAEAEDSSES